MRTFICFEIIPTGSLPFPNAPKALPIGPSFGSPAKKESNVQYNHLYIPCKEDGTPVNSFDQVERVASTYHLVNHPQKNNQVYVHIISLNTIQWQQHFSKNTKEGHSTSEKINKKSTTPTALSPFEKTKLNLKSKPGSEKILKGVGSLKEISISISGNNTILSFNASSGKANKQFYLNIELLTELKATKGDLEKLIQKMREALILTSRYKDYPIPIKLVDKSNNTIQDLTRNDSDLFDKIKAASNSIKSSSITTPDSKENSSDSKTITMTPEEPIASPDSPSIPAACPFSFGSPLSSSPTSPAKADANPFSFNQPTSPNSAPPAKANTNPSPSFYEPALSIASTPESASPTPATTPSVKAVSPSLADSPTIFNLKSKLRQSQRSAFTQLKKRNTSDTPVKKEEKTQRYPKRNRR